MFAHINNSSLKSLKCQPKRADQATGQPTVLVGEVSTAVQAAHTVLSKNAYVLRQARSKRESIASSSETENDEETIQQDGLSHRDKKQREISSLSQAKLYRFVKITVNGNELNALNVDNNVEFPVMDATVTINSHDEKGYSSIKLYEINHTTAEFFAPTNEQYSVEIFFCNNKVTTKLSAEMSLNLINFLKLYKPKFNSDYCCINFAYEMAYGRGKVVNDNDPENFDELTNSAFSEEKLVPGDIVHLFNARKDLHHYTISIGQNYYLSLFGASGPLIVSTLDACKKGFETDICVQAIKKKL